MWAACQRKGISGVGFREIGRELDPFAVHGIGRLAERVGEPFDTASQIGKFTVRGFFDGVTRGFVIAKGKAIEDGRIRMLTIVVHNIARSSPLN